MLRKERVKEIREYERNKEGSKSKRKVKGRRAESRKDKEKKY